MATLLPIDAVIDYLSNTQRNSHMTFSANFEARHLESCRGHATQRYHGDCYARSEALFA